MGNPKMNRNELKLVIMDNIATATEDQLAKAAAIVTGQQQNETEMTDKRLLTFTETAKELGLSRCTIWRMVNDGRLRAVYTTENRRRIPASEVLRLNKGEPIQLL